MFKIIALALCALFLGCGTETTTSPAPGDNGTSDPALKANTGVPVPAISSVRLGSADTLLPADERPAHQTALDAFTMSRYEVLFHEIAAVFNRQLLEDSLFLAVDTIDAAAPAYDTILLHKYKNPNLAVSGRALTLNACTLLVTIPDTFTLTSADSVVRDTVKGEIRRYTLSRTLTAAKGAVNLPATRITWFGAVAFCNFMSLAESLETAYDTSDWSLDTSKNGWRLPTEAEWEYAARGNRSYDSSYYPTGLTFDPQQANATRAVRVAGSYAANPFGLYDLSANVWEWCADNYLPAYYTTVPGQNPLNAGAADSVKVVRGGGFKDNPFDFRSARRSFLPPGGLSAEVGFRVVRRVH